jgi:lipid A ethanolaminephosphotransferase
MRIMFLDPPAKTPRATWLVMLLASLWMAFLGNAVLWRSLNALPDLSGWHGFGFAVAFAIMIAGVLCTLMALFAWRWLFKPVVSLLLLLSAFATYYMWMYGIVVDTPMVINVFQTDAREARDQLSWQLLVTVLLLAVLPIVILWRQHVAYGSFKQQLLTNLGVGAAGLLVSVAFTFWVFQDFASLMRNHTQLRYQINPLNSVYALLDLTVIPSDQARGPIQSIGLDATVAKKHTPPPLLILVLGETARSDHFSLNGYARNTNPLLAKESVVSFTNVTSCGTSTAESVPCMFSHLGREAYGQRQSETENFLDVLQRAGYAVLWIDNQSGCKEQCDRIANLNTSNLKNPEHCDNGECRDTIMLAELETQLTKLPADKRAVGTVVVMHQMGSHGPAYFKRTPKAFKPFQPECTDTSLSQCDRAQVVNAYDNTLVFTDYFLSRVIAWLKTHEKTSTPAMLYISDHGESLGENNLYLHGLPYRVAPKEQKHVPMITWLSHGFEQYRGINLQCLQKQRDVALSHDHLFHTVLGLMSVRSEVYQAERDAFAVCAQR